ncbi:MAG: VCBS domain-containing protein, partial [Mycobacterium sp.]|nr:VCBS domain-containing protein [Mycobacterium sp.]
GDGGSFSYTPTAVARHAAASLTATAADMVEEFTVTVGDGHGGSVVVAVSVAITPDNATPTGSSSSGAPDVTSGVVAGSVLGIDSDGDPLSYSAPGSTGKGAIVLSADGAFTYTPTVLARHAASLATATVDDTTDSFTVTISDGYGGTIDIPVSVTISPAAVTFNFVYGSGSGYWTADARSALEAAVASLSSYIVVEAPVSLTYDVIGQNSATSGLLATAYAPFSSSSVGYTGTVAQTKIITGVDANGSASDGSITWNFAYPWATGDRVGNRQYDFQAVALHEMLHTLGFLTGIESPTSMDRNWTIYDSFLATSDGTAAIGGDYVWNSAYTTNLTGGNGGLYFDGPNAVAAYGGLVPLYTPSTWASGSSVAHLDPNNPPVGTYIMDPADGFGPGARVIGAVELGILQDLGYTVTPSQLSVFVIVGLGLMRRRRE